MAPFAFGGTLRRWILFCLLLMMSERSCVRVHLPFVIIITK